MCTCIFDAELKLRDNLTKQIESKVSVAEYIENGTFKGLILDLDNGGYKPAIDFEIIYIKRKKDGTPERRNTTLTTKLIGTFCPLCGVRYPLKETCEKIFQ